MNANILIFDKQIYNMNLFAHMFAGIIIALLFFSHSDFMLILITVLLATFIDLDHIPYLKKAVKTKKFGYESRSIFHELFGLSIGLIMFVITSFYFYVMPFCLAFISHYFLDMLTRPTRPLYPFRKDVCHFNMYPKSPIGLVIADIIVTSFLLILVVILWI